MQQSHYLSLNNLPQFWVEALSLQLTDEEKVLAWIETDLNTQLHFAEGIVVVTNKRLLAKMAGDETWQEWHYQQGLLLTQRDYAGVGCLDFATDVIMIVMTAIILVSINPWLALVTLVPLPIIVWLIHLVRDRLRIGFEKVVVRKSAPMRSETSASI